MCEKTMGNIATYIHTAALQLSHPKVLHLYIYSYWRKEYCYDVKLGLHFIAIGDCVLLP